MSTMSFVKVSSKRRGLSMAPRMVGPAARVRRLTAVVAALLGPALLPVARGADAPQQAVLIAYVDGAGGAAVMAGDYAGAISRLAPPSVFFTQDELGASTNLCVAYAMTAQWARAHAACDQALMLARLETTGESLLAPLRRSEEIAVAASNKRVMLVMELERR
jgi:hypothetical protein